MPGGVMPDSKDSIAPKITREYGAEHPINQVKESIMNLLLSYGFEIKSGPEIETEEFNFDMLNIKKSHPARQMHDTFYVNNKSHVLRTHTSPVQIRGMLEQKPPLALRRPACDEPLQNHRYRAFEYLKTQGLADVLQWPLAPHAHCYTLRQPRYLPDL